MTGFLKLHLSGKKINDKVTNKKIFKIKKNKYLETQIQQYT